jgi:hypothetical protein
MHCILDGHKFVDQEGVGPYSGQSFRVCERCGRFENPADEAENQRLMHEAAGNYYRSPIDYRRKPVPLRDWEWLA